MRARRYFPPVAACDPTGRAAHSAAADLDGTLLVSRSSFPYFFLLAVEAGSLPRGLLLLLLSPLILLLYRLVSEPAAIQLMIFVSLSGIPIRDIELAARAVLPRFYAADVREESWRVFRACGRRRVVVTANPRVMVEPFVREQLGGDRVLGTELVVDRRTGRATGMVTAAGVMVGRRKREAVEEEFREESPDIGLGDRDSDHDFMAICKEAYMVPPNPSASRVPLDRLETSIVFHDGRFVRLPDPLTAFLTFLYLPLAVLLSLLRFAINLSVPASLVPFTYRLTGIRLTVRGTLPSPGCLFVCNHRTALDPIIIAVALGRRISCVTYSVSRLSAAVSPIPSTPLTRDRDADAARIADLLRSGDVVVCPEGTTCRGPFLLRFSKLFAELSDRIVPVAVEAEQGVFYGSTVRGWKFLDPYFFFMNPMPRYVVEFLQPLLPEHTCGVGGRPAAEVANRVQKAIGDVLGFECTTLTRKDKYMKLGGNEGKVVEEESGKEE